MKSWGRELAGTDPENLRVFRDFWLLRGFAAGAALKRRGGRKRGDFSMVRIRLARFALPRLGLGGSKSGRIRGQEFVVRGQDAVQSGPSKTSLASAGRPGAESIALRDHRLAEYANIEKVGRTRFFNLFRTVISFCRLVTTMVCKLSPRGEVTTAFI